jgi:hypothetical protein
MSLKAFPYQSLRLTAIYLTFPEILIGALELRMRDGSACFHICAVIGAELSGMIPSVGGIE